VFSDPRVVRMAAFLQEIGISLLAASSLLETNFPGLDIQYGAVLVDESRVVYVGDILHEAGHVAMTRAEARNALRLAPTGGEELSALAWSYAAALHLDLDPDTVFYPSSYLNNGAVLVESFAQGKYVGLPLMQAFGMTAEPKNAAARGVPPFPHMLRWLR
jgi:glyoxylase-like metal-dependent hydrolase (beta-lactamase superfamily II)